MALRAWLVSLKDPVKVPTKKSKILLSGPSQCSKNDPILLEITFYILQTIIPVLGNFGPSDPDFSFPSGLGAN